jgi:high-affinity K+ transport system ATPase subunit B
MPLQAAVIFSILIIFALIVPAMAGVRFLPVDTWSRLMAQTRYGRISFL